MWFDAANAIGSSIFFVPAGAVASRSVGRRSVRCVGNACATCQSARTHFIGWNRPCLSEITGFGGCWCTTSRSPWWKSVGSRYERHGARCKAPRRRRCSSSIKEWQRRSWPHAVVTRRAQGSSGHRLCHSSVTMTKHRFAPHFAPETRIPLRATLQTSTTGS